MSSAGQRRLSEESSLTLHDPYFYEQNKCWNDYQKNRHWLSMIHIFTNKTNVGNIWLTWYQVLILTKLIPTFSSWILTRMFARQFYKIIQPNTTTQPSQNSVASCNEYCQILSHQPLNVFCNLWKRWCRKSTIWSD